MGNRTVLLDFDGTLAIRPGLWGACVLELLDELEPGHGVELSAIRLGLKNGFPWHRPEVPHPELCEPDAWWSPVRALVEAVLVREGLEGDLARSVAGAVRERFCQTTVAWTVFPDTVPALERLTRGGWTCAILSNHVPELERIVRDLGLAPYAPVVFSSAVTGYEKPHPEAFALALRELGEPRSAWMVGDNPVADVRGAEDAGIPAILVRTAAAAGRRADDLLGAAELILAADR